MAQLIVTEKSELKSVLKEALSELRAEEKQESLSEKLYTRNQVRKRLGKAWKTIDNLIIVGLLKTTKDGLISEAAINEYLQKS
jgi:hypothetical protein